MNHADLASVVFLPPLPAAVEDAVERTVAAVLTPSEARVLRLRFGLGGHPRRSVEIARRLGLRVTTVLRLERRAVRKLSAAAIADEAATTAAPPIAHRWLAPLGDAASSTDPIPARKEWATRS